MPRIQVSVTEDQESKLNARALAVGGALKKPVSVLDLIRLWVDNGCPVGTATNEKEVVVGRETVSDKKTGSMPFPEAERCAEAVQEMFPAPPVNRAAGMLPSREGRAPIPRPGEKK